MGDVAARIAAVTGSWCIWVVSRFGYWPCWTGHEAAVL